MLVDMQGGAAGAGIVKDKLKREEAGQRAQQAAAQEAEKGQESSTCMVPWGLKLC